MAALADRRGGGALDGITVLDLSDGIAGAVTTMLLVDQGAEVTVIEPPAGNSIRSMSGGVVWARSKRSAVFDLGMPEDAAAVRALAAEADVVVASFAPGEAERLELDGATLCADNPALVYCAITAYGSGNRHCDRYDDPALVAARTGLMWEARGWLGGAIARMSGSSPVNPDLVAPEGCIDGAERAGPLFPYTPIPALAAAYLATTAISAALFSRAVTGFGQQVHTSQLQGVLAATWGAWQRARHPDAAGYDSWIFDSRGMRGMFECADGRWVCYWVPAPAFVLGASARDELAISDETRPVGDDPSRILPDPDELVVLHHYFPEMAAAFRRFPARDWVRIAGEVGVALQPVRSPEEALADPALLDCGSVQKVHVDGIGTTVQVGTAYRLSRCPPRPPASPPALNRDGDAVRAAAACIRPPAATPPVDQPIPRPPLDGIRVLDLGLAVAGPWGAQLLSDLGADVIKVNRLYDQFWHGTHMAMACNRGKRSLAVDLKHPRGLELLHRLVDSADVVHHNMRPDAVRRLGVDYDSLKARNSRLIYCQTTGFDPSRAHLPGNDQTGAALAGVAYEDGGCASGGRPIWNLTSLGDVGNGFLSAIGVVQALFDRERTGVGQLVETSILDAQLLNASYAWLADDGTAAPRSHLDAMQYGTGPFRRLYDTAEGWLCIAASDEGAQRRCLVELGGAHLANSTDLAATMAAVLRTETAASWSVRLDAAGVPNEVCSDRFALELFDDPDLRASRFVTGYPQPVVGHLEQLGVLFDFSATPARIAGAPLVVGDGTRTVLSELGLGEAEIADLEAAQVVMSTP
ncbi:CoA-transferase/lyase DddD [Mycolicibacterium vanbaalenii]|uniref:CoA-transferase/lyase DddD n=1 Tax=Mycolicibacterium vanbaalenii TaxID=110539 RepID=A0A5S9RB84_MYCVN|nr:CoA transferase [Mycolicibacterium vanbaalenii]CAA0136672.1 CoA-transferase/lyase DddD [Mycolicibacterium vanbaalenii]